MSSDGRPLRARSVSRKICVTALKVKDGSMLSAPGAVDEIVASSGPLTVGVKMCFVFPELERWYELLMRESRILILREGQKRGLLR